MRQALSSARPDSPRVRRFLEGLSADELRYLAEFLGAASLDSSLTAPGDRETMAVRIEEFQRQQPERRGNPGEQASHRMIVLLEFLSLIRPRPGKTAPPSQLESA